jgi:hypothetical protein
MDVHTLISELGYVIPTGIAGVLLVGFVVFMKSQETKQDKDRTEHMAKWDSMISMHKNNVQALIDSQQTQFKTIMEVHQRELDRQFKLYERNTSTLEALAHNLSLVVKERPL